MLNETINNYLKQLETWLQGNKLSLDTAEANSMLLPTKHNILKSQNKDLDLEIRDSELKIIQETEYLGV